MRLFFYALQLTTVSNAVFPYYMQPVFLTLLAPLFLKERLEPRSLLAFALAFSGLILLLHPSRLDLSHGDVLGIGLALAGALFLSIIALLARILEMPAATFLLYEMFISAICLLPFVRLSSLSLASAGIAAAIGVFHTALAYLLYYDGLKRAKIQYAATLTFLSPLVAAGTGCLLFQEPLTPYSLGGGALIIAGGLITVLHSRR
ncbi:MAG TPA: EamA family transporter [Bacillota bacterium]|nr:EamA family transporter [Bacillota bacterium]HOB86118.1 EamA family transporter [Bacillota bacterium]HOP68681.1 EamA family transporter [Bacillota bacterium]HPT34196.1 EamA family transporter [Bacillota bacterium]HQD06699.1 EamA family transporter [Bacillota bacterium]